MRASETKAASPLATAAVFLAVSAIAATSATSAAVALHQATSGISKHAGGLGSSTDGMEAPRTDLRLPDLLKEHPPLPLCAPCEGEEENACAVDEQRPGENCGYESKVVKNKFCQYEVPDSDLRYIWWRVVCINDIGNARPKKSLLGPTGHLERMNVWSHMFAAGVYLAYSWVRPWLPQGQAGHPSSVLAAVSYVCFIVTFTCSVVYHVYSANRFWSAATRLLDYFGIYLGIASGTLSDLSTTSINLKNVPWQSVADAWFAAAISIAFFVVRRTQLCIDTTRLPYLENKCSLGFGRPANVDLEHQSLRAGVGIAMAFAWVALIPGAFETLELDCAWIFAGSRFLGTGVLIAGMVWDMLFLYPDRWWSDGEAGTPKACTQFGCRWHDDRPGQCHGWIITAHTLWHMIALLSTMVTTAGTEYVIATSDVLRDEL